ALWRMSIEAELGDPEKVVALSRTTTPEPLNIVDRRQMYWIETGRALAQSGTTDREAEVAVLRAERLAPALFAAHPMTREVLSSMVRRAQYRSVSDDLQTLARRVGVDVAP